MNKKSIMLLMSGLCVLVLLIIILSTVSLNYMKNLSILTTKLYNHPYVVSTSILKIEANLVRMHRSMKDVPLAKNRAEIENAIARVNAYEREVYKDLEIVSERFLGDRKKPEQMRRIIADWKPIREDVITLMKAGRKEEAADITKGKGAAYVKFLNQTVKELRDFAQMKADTFLRNSQASTRRAFYIMYSLVTITVLIGIMIIISSLYYLRHMMQAEKMIRNNESFLRTVSENLPNIYLSIIERNLSVGYTAGKEFQRLNLDPNSFIGKSIEAVFSGFGADIVSTVRGNYLKTFEGEDTTFELFINNQHQLYHTAPLVDENGKINQILSVVTNITERKQAEIELRNTTNELMKSNEELDTYSHVVAHNLKTPLTSIIGYLTILRTQYSDLTEQERQSYMHIIAKNGWTMSNIIDELLLLVSVRKEEVQFETIDMSEAVAKALQRMDYQIESHKANIQQQDSWPKAQGHGPWVVELWSNLISNALKYGGQPPHVELGATVQPDGMIRFWTRDNGSGLKPEDQLDLFKPFTKLDQVQAEGHGLGLSIVRFITEKLGGQVGLESELGQGTVVYFTLPAEKCTGVTPPGSANLFPRR
ncbi:ATP-binding protein [candidate division CSSED10-310 bacterium]|uniref:histidine kinase n=1 Tax=candidate division CSSED10-310 bacterium TaxID=2855610 RepID=A0ABV6YWE4_UNCC1